jgi:hypothetical protein
MQREANTIVWTWSRNPTDAKDIGVFYVVTMISFGDGLTSTFGRTPWFRCKAKGISPTIFTLYVKIQELSLPRKVVIISFGSTS